MIRYDREVGLRVAPHELGRELPAVGKGNLDLGRAARHMVVREDMAISIYDHARADAPKLSLKLLRAPLI